jgi:citrate lyase subunit beta / citryl-CoA lyase
MSFRVRRSSLILPVNVPRFIDKAHTRGADAIVLDLEDSVPAAEKASARKLVKDTLPLVARGGAEVAVRVNNDPALLSDDIDASVWPGLASLSIPKVETAAEVERLATQVERLERARGIPVGHVKLSLAIETPAGVLACESIAASSPRIVTMGVGPEDYYLSLGVEPSADGMELLYAVSRVLTVCKAVGIQSVGLLGSIAGFRDLPAFEAAAIRARSLGCEGAGCIHPEQVVILNRVFSPDPQKVEYARRAVDAFEEGVKRGTASVNLDGKMVDVPVYRRALLILQRANAIAELERTKALALKRQGGI